MNIKNLGKNHLFRRQVNYQGLHEVFSNPRVHTGTGYHNRRERNNMVNGAFSRVGLEICLLFSCFQNWQFLGFILKEWLNRSLVPHLLGLIDITVPIITD